jgi:hypothetical protein
MLGESKTAVFALVLQVNYKNCIVLDGGECDAQDNDDTFSFVLKLGAPYARCDLPGGNTCPSERLQTSSDSKVCLDGNNGGLKVSGIHVQPL